jgi:hypothetical protein
MLYLVYKLIKVCKTLSLTVTRKAPRVAPLGAFLTFKVAYHCYLALWSLNHWHIMYATMPAITDTTKVVKLSAINSPPSCHQWAGNVAIIQYPANIYKIFNCILNICSVTDYRRFKNMNTDF